MRKRILLTLAVLIALSCAALWWQTRTNKIPEAAGPESAALPAKSAPQPTREAPRADKAEPQPKPPVAPRSAEPNQLKEWVESLVTLCLRRDKPQARSLYKRILPYRLAMTQLVRSKYQRLLQAEAPTELDQDGKLTALSYLALLLPPGDFMALLDPLRKCWVLPLPEGERKNAWSAVQKKYIAATADEALTTQDRIVAGVAAFVVGEYLRDGNRESLTYVTTCLTSIDAGAEHADLPDPWLSAILAHCGRELPRCLPADQAEFKRFARTLAFDSRYSARLRHQAKLLLAEDATSVFQLIEQLIDSLSYADAAAIIANYLKMHSIDRVEFDLIIDALLTKYAVPDVFLIMRQAFRTLPDMKQVNHVQTLASVFLESINSESGGKQICAKLYALRALKITLASNRRRSGEGPCPRLFVNSRGQDFEAIRRAISMRKTILDECGQAYLDAYVRDMLWQVFELDVSFSAMADLIRQLIQPEARLKLSNLAIISRGLADMPADELLAADDNLAALLDDILSTPLQQTEGLRDSVIRLARIDAASGFADLAKTLKLAGYPPLTKSALGGLMSVHRMFDVDPDGSTPDAAVFAQMRKQAQSAYVELDEQYSFE